MESNSTQSQAMITIVEKILSLIECDYIGKEEYYYTFFENVLIKLRRPHELTAIAREIMPVFGGMGTFNDLVLHQSEFVPLMEENDQFAALKNTLFALCEEIILEGEL